MKKKRLLMYLCLALMSSMAWAQNEASGTMTVTDVYGDTVQVPIRGGDTFYLPQQSYYSDLNYAPFQNIDYAPQRQGNLVIVGKDGVPRYSYPMNLLSSIVLKGQLPFFAVPHNLDKYTAPKETINRITFHTTDGDYDIDNPGEWKLDDYLMSMTLTTANGGTYNVPLSLLKSIERCQPAAGLVNYLRNHLQDAQVYLWAFYNGSTSAVKDYMLLYFFAAVPSYEDGIKNLTLLVPTDKAMSHYADPVSFKSTKSRLLNFYYYNRGSFPISYKMYSYNPETGTVAQAYNNERMTESEVTNRLRMILRSHAIVHSDGRDFACGNEYFKAMDGSVVRVVKDENGNPVGVQGTFEMDNEKNGLTNVTIGEGNNGAYTEPWSLTQCNFTETISKGNATVYKLDNPMNATPRSAYSVLSTDESFSRFFELCNTNEEVLRACGIVDNKMTRTEQQIMLTRFGIFSNQGGMDFNVNLIGSRPFTIFVPTNEAIESEVAKGNLPTWEEIVTQYEALPKDEDERPILTQADSIALQNKCMRLVNFIWAHIQFGLDIADQLPFEEEHNTLVVNPTTLATPRLKVKGLGQGRMTVTDETGQTRNVVNGKKNIFVRDISCSRNGKQISPAALNTMNDITVDGYANGVIHQIDGVLKYIED